MIKIKKHNLILGIVLFISSTFLLIHSISMVRVEFLLVSLVGAIGCGECIKRSQIFANPKQNEGGENEK